MRRLIGQIRDALPFAAAPDTLCTGDCRDCALKLLEFLDSELLDRERRLDAGECPDSGDLSHLAALAGRVRDALAPRALVRA